MATAAAAKKPTETPAAEAPAKREFSFAASFSVPVPATIPAPERASALPFKGMFSEVFAEALAGKQPHFFIPLAFFQQRNDEWAAANGKESKKVTHGDARGKINGQFNEWQKADEKTRSQVKLLQINRKGTEEGFDEPGLSVWLLKNGE